MLNIGNHLRNLDSQSLTSGVLFKNVLSLKDLNSPKPFSNPTLVKFSTKVSCRSPPLQKRQRHSKWGNSLRMNVLWEDTVYGFDWALSCSRWWSTCSYESEKMMVTLLVVCSTRVKISHLGASLQTSCYKSVHKLSTSCVRTACSWLL
jgi:hypothetical protein